MKKLSLAFLVFAALPTWAAPKITVKGSIPSGYSEAAFYSKKGYYTRATIRGREFSIAVPRSELKGGSIILNKADRQFGGAVVLGQKGVKSYLQLAANSASSLSLGAIVTTTKGYLKLRKALSSKFYDSSAAALTSRLGAPLGLNSNVINTTSIHSLANSGDTDQDGVPNGVDVDADGDGGVDVLTGGASADTQAPYLIVRENMSHTINQTATGIPSLDAIDEILTSRSGSEFAIGFAFSVRDDISRVTGAHVVCEDSNPLCGRTSGAATVNGASQSLWRDYHTDGTSYPGLDLSSGGSSEKFFNTGLSPNVGPSKILPGTTFRVEFTGTGGSVVRSRLATITPYLVSVPALHSYSANAVDHTVDYNQISTEPGASMDSPIILGSDGLLSVTFWRPQRQGLGGTDGTDFIDVGHLRYGLVLVGPAGGGGGQGEQACAGYYSGYSETLTEHTGVPPTNDFWSMTDSAGDATPSASNTMSFTVDVKSCATRAGYSAGDYMVSLQAAGADLGHGSNRSGQDFIVRIQ